LIERWAGLAPAFPRRKRGVFPWTTNASLVSACFGDQFKIYCTPGTWAAPNGEARLMHVLDFGFPPELKALWQVCGGVRDVEVPGNLDLAPGEDRL
jgi:hypothetical protein